MTLRLLATGKSVVIEVWDASPLGLEPREADADDEGGRGLTVVAALSDRRGCERTGHRRKVVWAELARSAPGSVAAGLYGDADSIFDFGGACGAGTPFHLLKASLK